jgi:hypothetical protein
MYKTKGLPSHVLPLTPGVESASTTLHEEEERIATLRATVSHYLPDLCEAVAQIVAADDKDKPMLFLHQDSFAAGYHTDEYTLLGMAVKYAGLHGVEVHFIGRNHETF